MNSFFVVYVVFLLTGYAAGSPTQVQRRGLPFPGSYQINQRQKQESAASSKSAMAFQNGPFGSGFSASSQSSQSSSSSYSYSAVVSSFGGLGSQISQMQSLFDSGSMTQQVAMQQMSQLASSFQTALSLAPSCGSCFAQGGFVSTISSVFRMFTQLMIAMQSSFGSAFGQICSPIASLQNSFQSFLESASSSGISLRAIFPAALPDILIPIIPALRSSFSAMGFQSNSATAFGSSGGGFGGFGGMGYGGGYSSSSKFSQQSSSSYSFSAAINGFSALGSQIGQIQSMIGGGSFSQQIAFEQMSQLASSFQSALSQASSCGSCFGQGAFSSSVSSVFYRFTQLLSSMQSIFPDAYHQVCSPLAPLQSSFQSFSQVAASSSSSATNIIPSSLPPLLTQIAPGFGTSLSPLIPK